MLKFDDLTINLIDPSTVHNNNGGGNSGHFPRQYLGKMSCPTV